MTARPRPTLHDVFAARPHVYRYLQPTPLYHYATLSRLLGAEVWVKHENHQPVGAFKVRGGLNLAAGLDEIERRSGLYTASTGNHGQSIAFAARVHGIKATIAVPHGANPSKVAAMRAHATQVVVADGVYALSNRIWHPIHASEFYMIAPGVGANPPPGAVSDGLFEGLA